MQNLQGGFMVVSRWMEKDTLKGFLLVDTSYHLHLIPLEVVQQNGAVLPYLNAQYDPQFQTLVGTCGASLTDYPVINKDYVITGSAGVVVMATVLDAQTKKPLGVVAFNGIGARFNLTYKKLNELLRKHNACNFKMVVDKQYGQIAVKKDGSYFDTVEITVPKAQKKVDDGKSCVTISSPGAIPVMGPYNMDAMRTNEFNQSAQEKLVRTMLNMSKLTPYYYTVLQAIPRKPAPMGTMGVTEDTLYYDPKFAAQLKVSELTFVLIHEIMHLAMQHPSRFGNRKSHDIWNIAADLYINSIICKDFGCKFGGGEVDFKNNGCIKTPDFGVYIETIGEKIDLTIDTPETIYDRLMKENNNGIPQSGSQGQPQSGQQGKTQKGGKQGQQQQQGSSTQQQMQQAAQLIAEGMKQVQEGSQRAQQQMNNGNGSQQAGQKIDQGLQEIQDAVNDAMSGNSQQNVRDSAQQGMQDTQSGVNQMNQSLQSGGSQPQQQQQGQPGQGQGQMSPQEQMQRGMNQIQQGLASMASAQSQAMAQAMAQAMQQAMSQSQPGQGTSQGQMGQGQQDMQDKSQSQGQVDQSNQSSLKEDDFGGSGEYSSMQEVNVTYNGKKLTGSIMRDVMSKNDSKKQDDVQQKLDASKKALQTISTKIKLEEEERGEALEKNAGAGGHLMNRYIEVGLSAGVDWRVIFRNICKDKPKKTFTLAQPNQDYMNMGMTIADRRRIGKPERVSHVKFAVDVSGSVSQKELMVTLSEINNIFNYFKLDGELIYWSTMVGDAGMFSSLKDMLKVNPETTGGTDVRCVFDYLAGKTKVHGKAEKDKVRDMKAVFIITDGCFSMNFKDYAEMFGRRVVWLITGVRGNTITFDPPFGRVLALDIDND